MLNDIDTDWTIGNSCDSIPYMDVFVDGDLILSHDNYLYNARLTVHGHIIYNGYTITLRCANDELIETGVYLSDNEVNKKEFFLFPNPTKNVFHINTDKQYKLYVVDLSGRTVSNSNNIEHLSSGLYFVNISIDDLIITKKIIKQ